MLSRSISLLSVLALVAVAGCETVEGAGQDIEDAGQTISNTAEDADE